jgi:hypothetical protein
MANTKLENFKKIVIKAMMLESDSQRALFDLIPDEIHESIFRNNFNENYQLARKIIFNDFDQDDYKKIEKEKAKIHDMKKATKHLSQTVLNDDDSKVLFLTDTDNDGSLAQANIKAFLKGIPKEEQSKFETLYCQQVNGNTARGFTVDLVDLWVENNPEYKERPFTIVTADNGINSREEQDKINEKYPNAMLIVTDHHNPDEDNVVQPNKNTMVVNPRFKPSKYFQEKNISGANVLGVLLENVLEDFDYSPKMEVTNKETVIEHMREISRTANLLDYVDTDITDKPLRDHLIEKYSSLGALMNVNNSLNKIITSKHTPEEIRELFSDVEGVDLDRVVSVIEKIKDQNVMAQKLFTLQYRFEAMEDKDKVSVSKDSIYADSLIELGKNDSSIVRDNINPNFIEQLRPFIYTYTTSNSLLDYEQGIMDEMVGVYNNLKRLERELQDEFGKSNLLNIEKVDNATIMYPKNSNHLSLLNRKLLGKIYNEENNGFLMILDSVDKMKASGSFRSIYRIQDILKEKNKIEKLFNIKLSFQGHDKAAGFFIEKEDDVELTPEIISNVNKFIDNSLSKLKEEDKRSYSHLIQTDFDFETIDLFNKYNKAIKGSLTNMQSLSPVVQFTNSTYLTNSKTLEDENLQNIVKNKKYGYVPANISFDGHTVILPTEMLRTMANHNFRDGIQVSFMNDGAFIGNKLIPDVNKQKLHKIKSTSDQRDKMVNFYEEHYRDKHFVELPIEKLKKSPFFKANSYGKSEYKRFESTIINILDRSNTDYVVVLDTEANGLGNAPKISNLGVVEMSVKPNSGNKLRLSAFENAAFISTTGKRFWLSKGQVPELKELTKSDYFDLSFDQKRKVLTKMIGDTETYYLSESFDDYKPIHNFKIDGSVVYVNREIEAKIGSTFIKDRDMKISEKITTLTGIDNTLLNKIGISSKEADKIFSERYKGKKCVFQAHNLPYDLGVIKGNMTELYNVMTDFENGNLLNDSAIYSREQKLAYDPIGIAVFEKDFAPALHGIQFFHSEASDLSLTKFFDNDKDGSLPDRTGRYVLKKKEKRVSIIDTKENTEIKVEIVRENASLNEDQRIDDFSDIQLLKEHVRTAEMPKSSIKYSVQALSDYDMIRAMILSSADFKIKTANIPSTFETNKDKLEFFMMNYHFDASLQENFENFKKVLTEEEHKSMFHTEGFIQEEAERLEQKWNAEQVVRVQNGLRKQRKPKSFVSQVGEDPKIKDFKKFAKDFLDKNNDLQCKFHETWAYKKVLQNTNPTPAKLKDKDLVSMISYKTSLSEDKVVSIMKDAIDYKKKYKLDNVLQKEPHNNIFFDECDVVMESMLTFKRPTDRNYNSYNHSVEDVVDMYLQNIMRTTCQHMRSQTRYMALDSYSRKQALSYKRGYKSDYIESSQNFNPEDVKFKFSASTLQQDQFAYGSLKKEVTEEQISEFSKKLEFLVRNEQMKYSVSKSSSPAELHSSLTNILELNDETVKAYKEELSEFFNEVYFSKKESNMKKCLELVQEAIISGKSITVPKMDPLMKREKAKLIELTENFSKLACNLGISKLGEFKEEDYLLDLVNVDKNKESKKIEATGGEAHKLMNFLSGVPEISEDELQNQYEEKFERIRNDFQNNPEVAEKLVNQQAIIDRVDIARRNPSKHMFEFNELMDKKLSSLRNKDNAGHKIALTATQKAKI